MKKLLLGLLATVLLTINLSAQTATHEEVVTKKKKGKLQTYVTANGESFSVGDIITLGVAFRNENYDFIQQNAGIAWYPLPNIGSGSEVKIKKIKISNKLIQVTTTKPNGFNYGLIIINFDGAIENGEIISKNYE